MYILWLRISLIKVTICRLFWPKFGQRIWWWVCLSMMSRDRRTRSPSTSLWFFQSELLRPVWLPFTSLCTFSNEDSVKYFVRSYTNGQGVLNFIRCTEWRWVHNSHFVESGIISLGSGLSYKQFVGTRTCFRLVFLLYLRWGCNQDGFSSLLWLPLFGRKDRTLLPPTFFPGE